MQGRRNPFVAQEGIPFLIAALVLIWLTWRYLPQVWLPLPIAALIVSFLVFRDPVRVIPSSALGIVSPVDGTVVQVDTVAEGVTTPSQTGSDAEEEERPRSEEDRRPEEGGHPARIDRPLRARCEPSAS